MTGPPEIVMVEGEALCGAPFLLTWDYDPAPLAESIGRIGLTTPLLLRRNSGALEPVCGVRRAEALRSLEIDMYPARILPEGTPDASAARTAVEENLGHRTFNDAEKVLAVRLTGLFAPVEEIVDRYLPRLGLPARREIYDRYVALGEMGPDGLTALARGELDAETAEAVMNFDAPGRAAVFALLRTLRPGLNKRRQLVAWLDEIARREGLNAAAVVADGPASDILADESAPRPEKAARLREYLRRRRHPVLSELEDRRAAAVKALALPQRLRLHLPANFEGLEYRLEMTFEDLESFRDGVRLLAELAENPDFAALLDLG